MIRRTFGYLKYRDTAPLEATAQLQDEGYALLKSVFSAEEVTSLRDEIDHVFETEPADERGPNEEAWDMFRYAMLNRSAACQQAVSHRGILDVIEPLLGEDCHVIANTAWRNPPSKSGVHGGERWHIDAGPHVPLGEDMVWPADIPHPVFALGCHIYLQRCRIEDGPTGVIPGSHLSGRTPPADRLLDDDLTFNGVGVTSLLAEPGDVGLFVSDVWHRRMTTLPGDNGRYFLQVHYGRRDIAQRLLPTDEVNQLSSDAIARAETDRERSVIGLHPKFFYDG